MPEEKKLKKSAKKRTTSKKSATKRAPAKKKSATKKASPKEAEVKVAVKTGKRKSRVGAYAWTFFIILLVGFIGGLAVGREGVSVKLSDELESHAEVISQLEADKEQLEANLEAAAEPDDLYADERAALLGRVEGDACENFEMVAFGTPQDDGQEFFMAHIVNEDLYAPVTVPPQHALTLLGRKGCSFFYQNTYVDGPGQVVVSFDVNTGAFEQADLPEGRLDRYFQRPAAFPVEDYSAEEHAALIAGYDAFLEDGMLYADEESGLWYVERATWEMTLLDENTPDGIVLEHSIQGPYLQSGQGLFAPGYEGGLFLTLEKYNATGNTVTFRIYTPSESGEEFDWVPTDETVIYQLP